MLNVNDTPPRPPESGTRLKAAKPRVVVLPYIPPPVPRERKLRLQTPVATPVVLPGENYEYGDPLCAYDEMASIDVPADIRAAIESISAALSVSIAIPDLDALKERELAGRRLGGNLADARAASRQVYAAKARTNEIAELREYLATSAMELFLEWKRTREDVTREWLLDVAEQITELMADVETRAVGGIDPADVTRLTDAERDKFLAQVEVINAERAKTGEYHWARAPLSEDAVANLLERVGGKDVSQWAAEATRAVTYERDKSRSDVGTKKRGKPEPLCCPRADLDSATPPYPMSPRKGKNTNG